MQATAMAVPIIDRQYKKISTLRTQWEPIDLFLCRKACFFARCNLFFSRIENFFRQNVKKSIEYMKLYLLQVLKIVVCIEST